MIDEINWLAFFIGLVSARALYALPWVRTPRIATGILFAALVIALVCHSIDIGSTVAAGVVYAIFGTLIITARTPMAAALVTAIYIFTMLVISEGLKIEKDWPIILGCTTLGSVLASLVQPLLQRAFNRLEQRPDATELNNSDELIPGDDGY